MNLSKAEKNMLENDVVSIHYTQCSPRTIFCVIIAKDGHEIYGTSSCRDLSTFDEELGKLFALRHALSRLFRRTHSNVDM